MISQFEKRAQEMGVAPGLTSMHPVSEGNLETYTFKITADGPFHKILSFINGLERERRYLKVTELDIGEEVDGESKASFKLSTFRFLGE